MNIIKTLVLSGGGIKGVAQLGALQYLYKKNMLSHIETVAGSSIGSINGFLIIIGYAPRQIFDYITGPRYCKYLATNRDIIKDGGFSDASDIMETIKELMRAKNIDINVTFLTFFKKYKIKLIFTGSCLSTKTIEYFSHESHPNMKILDAIRISISFPLLITPIVYKNRLFIDGACLNNYPINLFTDNLDNVFGIRLIDKTKHAEVTSIFDFIYNSLTCMLTGIAKNEISNKSKEKTLDIEISNDEMFTSSYSVPSIKTLKKLYQRGFEYGRSWTKNIIN